MSTLILSRDNVSELLDMPAIIDAVEQAFRDWAQGKAAMPAKAYLVLPEGDFRAMPAALPGAVGIKWVNVHPENPSRGLPTVMATLVYNDPLTGYPLAIMEATDITAYRTGATAAIASRYLARKSAHTLGIIGAGRQACTQLTAHAEIFELIEIRLYDPLESAVARFIKSFPRFPVRACSLVEALEADILSTVTPSRKPFVRREWIRPGTHINAVGADARGKEELEPALLKEAVLVVDDLKQASSAGEINVPWEKGLIGVKDIYATLGEIIIGKKPGRIDEKSITIFDSTGLAIEDIAVARLVYEKARDKGGYRSVDFAEEALKISSDN